MEIPYITGNQFLLLAWKGTADGTVLTPLFDVEYIKKRVLTIKRIFIKYYQTAPAGANKEYFETDNSLITANLANVSPEFQILPYDIADDYDNGLYFNLNINGSRVTWLNNTEGLPIQFDMNDLYITLTSPLQTIDISLSAKILGTIVARDIITPYVKVVMEVYLDLFDGSGRIY